MRDDRQPFRLADLQPRGALLPSLFMAVYGVMSQPSQRVLPVLRLASMPSAWLGGGDRFQAGCQPGGILGAAAGAVGGACARAPAVVAHAAVGRGLWPACWPVVRSRAWGAHWQWSPALWVASVWALLGGALGDLAGFAWFGMVLAAPLWAWPLLVSGLPYSRWSGPGCWRRRGFRVCWRRSFCVLRSDGRTILRAAYTGRRCRRCGRACARSPACCRLLGRCAPRQETPGCAGL